MKKNEFEQIDPLIDDISEQVSELIEGEHSINSKPSWPKSGGFLENRIR